MVEKSEHHLRHSDMIQRPIAQMFGRSSCILRSRAALRFASTGKRPELSASEKQFKEDGDTLMKFVTEAYRTRIEKVSFEPEVMAEHREIAREYTKQKTKQTARIKHDIGNKCWLKGDAVRALKKLPPHQQYIWEHAKTIDHTPPPFNRPFPYLDHPPHDDEDVDEASTISATPANSATPETPSAPVAPAAPANAGKSAAKSPTKDAKTK